MKHHRGLSARAGLVVTGRAFAGAAGGGARARGRGVGAVFVLVALAGALLLTGAVGDAPANTTCLAPRFLPENQEVSVHATRVFIKEVVEGGSLEGCSGPIRGHAEYAESESGPWILTSNRIDEGFGERKTLGNGTTTIAKEMLFIGSENAGATPVLQHLMPERTYYARFVAEDEVGKAQTTVEFTTTPISKPEIIEEGDSVGQGFHLRLAAALAPKSVAVRAPIQTNGALTTYRFEYALGENGHAPASKSAAWKPFTSGAEGTVSAAEDFASPGPEATVTV